MDYSSLTDELLKKMAVLIRSNPHKKFGEFVEGEMFVLNHLTFCEKAALPSELSAVMNTSTARIAAILNSLERKGWITREIDEADRRRILVTLTPSGKQFVLEKHKLLHDNMEHVLQKLGEKDTGEILRILDRFIDIYKEMVPLDKNSCPWHHNTSKPNQDNKGEPLQ